MPIKTTCIGAWPKPDYVPHMEWFHEVAQMGKASSEGMSEAERTAIFDRATQEAVAEQAALGIDIPTDGEIRRPNYVHYHCSHLAGFELDVLTECSMRNGFNCPIAQSNISLSAPGGRRMGCPISVARPTMP